MPEKKLSRRTATNEKGVITTTLRKVTPKVDSLEEATKIKTTADLGNGYVYMEKGVTKDMGNFNFAKVTVGITVPIGATKDQLDLAKETLAKTNVIVDKMIEQEVNALLD